jgi:hypothetical protein
MAGYADETDHERGHREASARADKSRYGIGAAYVGRAYGHSEVDGWRGIVAVSDGGDGKVEILVAVGTVPTGAARGDRIAALVEEMAGDYIEPSVAVMADATTKSEERPGLRLDERFPVLWEAAFDLA